MMPGTRVATAALAAPTCPPRERRRSRHRYRSFESHMPPPGTTNHRARIGTRRVKMRDKDGRQHLRGKLDAIFADVADFAIACTDQLVAPSPPIGRRGNP